jgi:hypothetical protein
LKGYWVLAIGYWFLKQAVIADLIRNLVVLALFALGLRAYPDNFSGSGPQ